MDVSELLERYAEGERFFCDLSLRDANLSGVELWGAKLRNANLSGANLTHANLYSIYLVVADLSYADFRNANLRNAKLSGANLSAARLCGADLSKADLSAADLSDANLQNAKLIAANLSFSNLSAADLTGVNLEGTILSKAERIATSKIDWTALLQAQQADFIQRLKLGCPLHCETEGQHSELTIISGKRLDQLIDFCWEMAEKYKRNNPVRKVFINNMKGKLGEEVVKSRLAELVTEIDYEKRLSGDGKVDFRLTLNPAIGIQVKTSYNNINQVQWTISQEEVEKNAILVCILNQEEFDDRSSEYNLIMAGFLPTNAIQLESGKASIGINQLLYSGGLRSYLAVLAKNK